MFYSIEGYGSDVEWFMTSPEMGGKILPAWKFLPLTDRNNKIDLGGGFSIFADNAAVELNTPPAPTREGLVSITRRGFQKAVKFIQAESPEAEVLCVFGTIPACSGELTEEDAAHPLAMEIGCSPFLDAFTNDVAEITPEILGTTRVASGHLHFSFHAEYFTARTKELRERIFRLGAVSMEGRDMFPGYWKSLFKNTSATHRKTIEKDFFTRARTYGIPAAMRFSERFYGFEYRTPPNYWVSEQTDQIAKKKFSDTVPLTISDAIPPTELLLKNRSWQEEYINANV